MFEKAVWATDGSQAADVALPYAKGLATDGGGELLIFYCEELTAPGLRSGIYPAHLDEEELRSKIDGQVAELTENGLKATLRVVRTGAGGAAHAIADVARDEHSDVIVVGTRGHTALGGLLLGSVTQRLLHIAPCPVLGVPAANGHASR